MEFFIELEKCVCVVWCGGVCVCVNFTKQFYFRTVPNFGVFFCSSCIVRCYSRFENISIII